MAIGLGYMFGFKFPENFNYPYIAKSIQDFWRRWHISLSIWFRDYVYIPLGGNRSGNVYMHLLIVFLLTGLWHGASWNFIVWGLWHGFFLIIERILITSKFSLINIPYIIKWLYTMIVVVIGWIIFRAENITYAFDYIKIMFIFKDIELANNIFLFILKDSIILMIFSLMAMFPVSSYLNKINNKVIFNVLQIIKVILYIVLLIMSIVCIVPTTYNPFLYFNF